MSPDETKRAIAEAASRAAKKWQAIRDNNSDAAWDDFAFYKGNSRFANGVSAELGALDIRKLKTSREVCDAARKLIAERSWDSDYDEPDAVRNELYEAIDALR